VHDVTIGGGNFGDDYDRRNLIGSATGGGVVVDGATDTLVAGHDNHIVNNFIGVGYNGNTNAFVDRGNGAAGITLAGPERRALQLHRVQRRLRHLGDEQSGARQRADQQPDRRAAVLVRQWPGQRRRHRLPERAPTTTP
jgi:hypothetical protein